MRYVRPTTILSCCIIGFTAYTARAGAPQLGGPMKHILVTLDANALQLAFESPDSDTLDLQHDCETHTGAAAVLNDSGFNAQYGWLAGGFINLPTGYGIAVEMFDRTPGLRVYDAFTFQPILGTDGADAVWQWSGVMTHNWYATRVHGPHRVRHEIFVADLDANPLDAYTSATVDLHFDFNPDLSGRIGETGAPSVGVVPAPVDERIVVSDTGEQ